MTDRYTCIDCKEYMWKIKEIYNSKSSFNDNMMDIIKDLINTESIESTKAKESNDNFVII